MKGPYIRLAWLSCDIRAMKMTEPTHGVQHGLYLLVEDLHYAYGNC